MRWRVASFALVAWAAGGAIEAPAQAPYQTAQRPLATVVIGGVLSSALLSFLFMPAALFLIQRRADRRRAAATAPGA